VNSRDPPESRLEATVVGGTKPTPKREEATILKCGSKWCKVVKSGIRWSAKAEENAEGR